MLADQTSRHSGWRSYRR